ncbi:MAG: hypothetical protein CO118_00200 [Flavobacteriales bacterium CG_4_9_14_3_um_filter_32_8]|nr:MAG: hypothetical protein CO118_00200 [Flavobacteriales bacterium CG_4_9_14_3_um_filter_32_8]
MLKICKFSILILGLLFIQNANSQIVINEYSCANATSGGDPDFFGQMEDWIELYNTTGVSINLNGYHLSDKATNPTKFQIPGSISIPANGYMMVYCSGRAQIAGGSQIHTNFKLTQTKFEKIVLSDPSGIIIDSLTIVPNQVLHSRGRTTNGAATWSLFTNSTPNASNTGAMLEYASKPIFNVPAGFYPGAQSVSISTPDPNITIHYTLDGSDPLISSPTYSVPINIATTKVLRARCFSSIPNIPPSFIETNTYFINVTHTVPVVSICGNNVATLLGGSQIEPDGSLEFFDRTGVMQTEATGDFNKHGNDSWAYNQRGVDFITRDQYGYNYALQNQIFPSKTRNKFQRLILKCGASDNYPFEGTPNSNYAGELGGAHIRDSYVHTLSQLGDLHLDERTYDACVLYVNGNYWGVYESREKVDDSDFLNYYYGQDEQYYNSPNYIQYLATWGGTNTEYGMPNAQPNWDALVNYINSNNMAIPANFNYVTSQYNWKSLVDYFVLNSYIVNHDMLNWNTSWWRGLDTSGTKTKWRYSLWDMDATFNHYTNYTGLPNTGPATDPCQIDNLPNPGGQGHTEILNELMNNPIFEQYYISRYIDLSNTTFKCTNMIAVLDSLVNIITPEMPSQISRWGGNMAQWLQNVQDLRDFINTRCVAMNTGLVNCYSVTGPFPLKVNVTPAGAGDAQINSIIPPSYVYSGNYFGNIDILLAATANAGYLFDYWEVFNHPLDSAITNPNNSLQITQSDSIVAHFILIGDTVQLTFNVDPVGGGNISINGFTPPSYSYSNFYPEMSTLNLVATPQPGYAFVNWTSNTTAFVPTGNNPSVQITVDLVDSIVAHFAIIDTFNLIFNVDPVGGGNISIDGYTPPSYSYTNGYQELTVLNLVATPQPGYLFINWTSNSTPFVVSANDMSVQITVNNADSIVAHFAFIDTFDIEFRVSPVLMGEVEIDSNFVLDDYTTTSVVKSYITGTVVKLIETPISNYLFDHWESNFHTLAPSILGSIISFTVLGNDVITAVYVEEILPPPNGAQIPMAFSPNGDGNNDFLFVYGSRIESLTFDVFDRWGEKVFSSSSLDKGWDGNYKGKKATSGVYVYKLRAVFTDGEVDNKTGNITLVR